MEGAGRENSIGVSIRLPFEQGANPIIAGDEKYVSMKYFFTRKLMLVKESRAFVCLPGGFGTLDETFELLTLTQTGKGMPVPIVFLDTPGDEYWERVHEFVEQAARQPRSRRTRSTPRCTASPTPARRRSRRSSASTPTSTRSATSATTSSSGSASPRPTTSWPSSTSDSGTSSPTARSGASSRSRSSGGRTTTSTSPASRSNFAKHGYGDLRALIDQLNSYALTAR